MNDVWCRAEWRHSHSACAQAAAGHTFRILSCCGRDLSDGHGLTAVQYFTFIGDVRQQGERGNTAVGNGRKAFSRLTRDQYGTESRGTFHRNSLVGEWLTCSMQRQLHLTSHLSYCWRTCMTKVTTTWSMCSSDAIDLATLREWSHYRGKVLAA